MPAPWLWNGINPLTRSCENALFTLFRGSAHLTLNTGGLLDNRNTYSNNPGPEVAVWSALFIPFLWVSLWRWLSNKAVRKSLESTRVDSCSKVVRIKVTFLKLLPNSFLTERSNRSNELTKTMRLNLFPSFRFFIFILQSITLLCTLSAVRNPATEKPVCRKYQKP